MKTTTFLAVLLFAICPNVKSQCTQPFSVPYTVTSENTAAPALPDCMASYFESFASNERFETIAGPVSGFTGNVLGYSTAVNTEAGIPEDSWTAASLISYDIQLTQGVAYTLSYKYGISDSQKNIDNVYVSIGNSGEQGIFTHQQDNITGEGVATYTSEPFTAPETKSYKIFFSVSTKGTQGIFYLDDISIQEAGAMAIQQNKAGSLQIYPNPVQDVLHINNASLIQKADIYSISGRLMQSYPINSLSADINMQHYQSGIYFVAVTTAEGIKNIKVVKQ